MRCCDGLICFGILGGGRDDGDPDDPRLLTAGREAVTIAAEAGEIPFSDSRHQDQKKPLSDQLLKAVFRSPSLQKLVQELVDLPGRAVAGGAKPALDRHVVLVGLVARRRFASGGP